MPQSSTHGGDIYSNRIQLDFSVNINPVDIGDHIRSKMAQGARAYALYPEADNVQLREAIGKIEGLGRKQVLCGNGASELLAAVMHAFRPGRVLIPQPAFEGYTWAAQMVKAQLADYRLYREDGFALTEKILDVLTEELDMLILTNPSNPVGRLITPELLLRILERCRQRNILVLLDECFIEFTRQKSACGLLSSFQNLIILRAFTKIYGMPGVRLGYLLASETCCSQIARQLPEWNLSVLAQEAGLAVLEDSTPGWNRLAFIEKTRHIIEEERENLKQELINATHGDLTIYPSEANFLLLQTGIPLYDRLLGKGILIRDCSNYPGLGQGYYRIAVRGHGENEKLLREIAKLYPE